MHKQFQKSSEKRLQILALYSFITLNKEQIDLLLDELNSSAIKYQVKGTILFAKEGVNGTICGSAEAISYILEKVLNPIVGNSLEMKVSWSSSQVFKRFKARRKPEIVTMGVDGINPSKEVGVYVEPQEWNEYIKDPETLVIDTRNIYEVGIGTFKGTVNPKTNNFREFPYWVKKNLWNLIEKKKPKRIAMFCTGGIRCEKATSYLLDEGFSDIYHLHGGILRYLEEVPKHESLWSGECFVFDGRVALNHDLIPGEHSLCYACGMPLNNIDRNCSSYIRGVQCHHCIKLFSDSDRVRFAERQKQFDANPDKNLSITFD